MTFEYQMETFRMMDELFEKERLLMEYEIDIDIPVMEAAAAAAPRQGGNRIIEFFKKIFEAIRRAISKMVNAVTSFFSRNKGKKSPNVIASSVVGDLPSSRVPKNRIGEDISIQNGQYRVKIPSHSKSSVKPAPLNIPQTDIDVIFSGSDEIIFKRSPNGLFRNASPVDQTELKNEKKNVRINSVRSIIPALEIICNQNEQTMFFKYINRIIDYIEQYSGSNAKTTNTRVSIISITERVIEMIYSKGSSDYYSNDAIEFKTNMDEIKKFQASFARLHERFLKTFDPNVDFNKNREIARAFTQTGDALAALQMSINSLTNQIVQSNHLSVRYWGTITEPRKLAKFAKACIDSGIPYKFIMYNVWLISDKDLHGGLDESQYSPIWGQSRGVFFPLFDQEIIYKIALSGWGISSNKTECDITKILENTGNPKDIKLVPKVLDSYEQFTMLKMERVRISKSIIVTSDDIKTRFDEALARFNHHNNKHVSIRLDDLHSKNIGYDEIRRGPVVLDYGWGARIQ